MNDIKAKLAVVVQQQQAVVDQLQLVADVQLPAAKVKLADLKALRAGVKPADDVLVTALVVAGIVKE